MDAKKALSWGMISEVIAIEGLVSRACEIASVVAQRAADRSADSKNQFARGLFNDPGGCCSIRARSSNDLFLLPKMLLKAGERLKKSATRLF